MNTYYTNEKNTQILLSLMKQSGIRKIVASPGTTNISLVASVQQDEYFQVYSSVDERSAAYIACGLAKESGEPIVITCTCATASRNYIPALTEAFYSKLPVLAVTFTQHTAKIGHHIAQVIDRSVQLNDMVKMSVELPTVYCDEDSWACEIKLNNVLLALKRDGGGPAHINMVTTYSNDFSVKELPVARKIDRICVEDEFPILNNNKVGVFVGAHPKFNDGLTKNIDEFCEKFNAVVICDHTSNYKGKYRVLANLIAAQGAKEIKNFDLMIHIGEVSGAYLPISANEVWRVNLDGEIRDTFKKLTNVFEMSENYFFNYYANDKKSTTNKTAISLIDECKNTNKIILNKISELPFSNVWIAKNTANKLPENSIFHLGILNSLRSWNFFEVPQSVLGYSNTGGFGSDGCVSTLIGSSLANPKKLHFGFVGDLAFFYDMNSIGNRHVENNIRLMIVNNGGGTEFRNYNHRAAKFGEDANDYMAAFGHYGNKSDKLIKNYAENLGFEYLSAKSKDEYLKNVNKFVNPKITNRPILFEVFTDEKDESDALKVINNLDVNAEQATKNVIKNILGDKGVKNLKKFLGKG